MPRPKRPAGVALAHFESAVLIETDECQEWPYITDKAGYGIINVVIDGQPRTRRVHRLALERAAGPPPSDKPLACHGRDRPCVSPACFNSRHLYWGSAMDNTRDRYRDGTVRFGESHERARFSDADIAAIRDRHAAGERQCDLAAEFGCSRSYVSLLVNGKKRVGPPS